MQRLHSLKTIQGETRRPDKKKKLMLLKHITTTKEIIYSPQQIPKNNILKKVIMFQINLIKKY